MIVKTLKHYNARPEIPNPAWVMRILGHDPEVADENPKTSPKPQGLGV